MALAAEKKKHGGFEKGDGAEQDELKRWVQTLVREVSCIKEL